MTDPLMSPTATAPRLAKIMALLDSDHAGEALAAARALRRILDPDMRPRLSNAPADSTQELQACLAYAVEAIDELTQEIKALRCDNARLRTQATRHRASVRARAARAAAVTPHAPYPIG